MIRFKYSSVRLMDSQTWTYQQVNGEKIINTGYANLDCLKLNILSIYPIAMRDLESEVNSNTVTLS